MSQKLVIDIQKIYKDKYIQEFKLSQQKMEKLTKEISYQLEIQELARKGLIRVASWKKVKIKLPPKLPGKSWSEILKEIRE